MLNKAHVSTVTFRSERSTEIAAACDITENAVVIELFDKALCRTYSRTALFGVKITPKNVRETLEKLFSSALKRAKVESSAITGVVLAAGVHTAERLSEELSAKELGLGAQTEIVFVPYISARLSGRFTAALLAIPSENFLAVDLGASLCAAESKNGRLCCAGFPLLGAFDGTALESGMPAENGAIDAVRRESGGTVAYEVVGDAESVGISPAGAVCAAQLMLRESIIDADGIMTDRDLFAVGEDFFVSQSDIRAIQSDKAKCAAIFEFFGNETPYLSGEPFSNNAGFRAMSAVGAVPERIVKANFCKNSTLRGAENYLLYEKFRDRAREIIENAEDISERIANEFDEKYYKHLKFTEKL